MITVGVCLNLYRSFVSDPQTLPPLLIYRAREYSLSQGSSLDYSGVELPRYIVYAAFLLHLQQQH